MRTALVAARALPVRRVAQALALLAAAWLASGCASTHRSLRVYATADIHGHYAESTRALADVLDREARDGVSPLLIDAGDMWSGTLLSDRNEGALGIALFNALGYHAAALGNHEFDYGPVGVSRDGSTQPFGALRARLAEAQFPMLAANLVDRATGALPAWENLHASVMLRRAGFRIGIIGVITTTTPSITFPYVGDGLRFDDPTEAVVRESAKLRDAGAEVIIVSAHMGGACRPPAKGASWDPDDTSQCEQDSELFTLARRLPHGIVDVIVGGHTNGVIAHRLNGIALLQPGGHGRYVGSLDIVDIAGIRSIELRAPKRLKRKFGPDHPSRLDPILEPAEHQTTTMLNEDTGARLVRPLTRDRINSSPLGAFVCDQLLASEPDADICLYNSGGLRADLPAGPLRWGQLYSALPFGNAVAGLTLTGAQLVELVRIGTSGRHGVLQTAGLTITYNQSIDACPTVDRDGDGDIDPADRDRVVRVRLANGKAVDPGASYQIVTNAFLARGGDGFRPVIDQLVPSAIQIDPKALPDREVIAKRMRELRPIINGPAKPAMPEPRVIALGSAPTGTCE